MGTYFNPVNESFAQAVRSRIYVDKTGLLEELNGLIDTEDKCVALSHARRFGKSQAAGMIDAYYSCGSDSRELFSRFEIASAGDFEYYLNKYNVIHVDVSSMLDNLQGDVSDRIWNMVYREMKAAYPDILAKTEPIAAVLQDVYQQSGRRFVIILDEWDCVVRNCSDRQDVVHSYLQFLHAVFKSEESKRYLALGYITGILPIKKIKDESALNNFREYTMLRSKPLTRFFGFTEGEVRKLCTEYNMDFGSIQKWYNGYLIDGEHMYNPNSVYCAMVNQQIDSYWKNTASFEVINKFITLNMDGLKDDVLSMLAGGKVSVDVGTFQNDLTHIRSRDESLTALIHLGYLGYDARRGKAFIPNYEVATAFQSAIQTSGWSRVAKSLRLANDLLFDTIDGNAEQVAAAIELAHETYTSVIKYNDENALSCVLTMAYFTAPAYYDMERELASGKGYADMVFRPRRDTPKDMPAMVVELKWDQSADAAIKQIKDKRYALKLKQYDGKVLLAAINYDKGTKKHECIIEEYR